MDAIASRRVPLAGGTAVDRYLPTRWHTTVGAWCFLDHYGPDDVEDGAGMQVGPHPHSGLQTVTWLLAGEVVHRDSLGSVQPIVPGQLNLMTAGAGVAHAEESPVPHPRWLHGLQLWVALPERSRWCEPAFEHHPVLPVADLGQARATVLVGEVAGSASDATVHTPLVGADIVVAAGGRAMVPVERGFEHALLVVAGEVALEGERLSVGACVYLPPGRTGLDLGAGAGGESRCLLLGGEPFTEPLVMWWNFVGRTSDEIAEARADWEAGLRFPAVTGARTPRMEAPPLPAGRLRPRGAGS